jgi:hypothetical protein
MKPVAIFCGAPLGHAAVSAATLAAAAVVTINNPRLCMLVSGRMNVSAHGDRSALTWLAVFERRPVETSSLLADFEIHL